MKKFSYDKKYDDLFIHRGETKTYDCLEYGKLIFDVDEKGRIIGIQIADASEFLAEKSSKSQQQLARMLANLNECAFTTEEKSKSIKITVHLRTTDQEASATINVPKRNSKNVMLAKHLQANQHIQFS